MVAPSSFWRIRGMCTSNIHRPFKKSEGQATTPGPGAEYGQAQAFSLTLHSLANTWLSAMLFVANGVHLTVDQGIIKSLPDCRKWSLYGRFVPVMPYEYDLDEREGWCNDKAVNLFSVGVWIENWLLSAILK
jgi:hypothetical protein